MFKFVTLAFVLKSLAASLGSLNRLVFGVNPAKRFLCKSSIMELLISLVAVHTNEYAPCLILANLC